MDSKLAEAYVEIGADMKPMEAAFASIRKGLNKLASTRFNLPGGGLLAGLGLVGAGAALGKSISGASDLSETMSKVAVTFGDNAKVVTDAADQMAKAFGVPKREFLDAASMFGLIATGSGIAEKEAAGMSAQFARLAADAASFYNVPVDVALEKIRAGLTGESEPLKAFGVLMDEAATKSMAMSMGLAKQGEDLSNQAKFVARAAIITQGLSRAQGDLERTAGGAANQSRMFWGQLQNLGDAIGSTLLPAFTETLRLLNEIASDMAKAAESGSGAWAGFVNAFRSAIEAAGVIYRNWSSIVERTGVMIGGWIQNMVERFTWLRDTIGAFLGWFGENWRSIFQDAFNAVATALANLGKNFADFGQAAYDWIASGFTKPFEMKFTPMMEGFNAQTTAFQAPELKLSSVQDQLQAIDDRMAESEQKRADDKAAEASAAANPAIKTDGAVPQGQPKKEELKSEFVGLADFAKKIQSGSFGKDKTGEETAKNTARANTLLQKLVDKGNGNAVAVAAGPA